MTTGERVSRLHEGIGNSRYEVLDRLGQGTMGLVHSARDLKLDRVIALKTLRNPDPDDLYRLKHEFRSLAGLSHPNLVQLYELIVTTEQCFFTMELIAGVDFVAYVRGGRESRSKDPLTNDDFHRLRSAVRGLADGLSALHTAGKLHRDVKPSNVLVEPTGRVVLLDFGLASSRTSQQSLDSQAGTLVGTLAYMAPEQAWGEPVSPAADWYSVGVMLYETLTGRLPFEGAGLRAVLAKREHMPLPPSTVVPGIPAHLDALTMALLAQAPADRPSHQEILAQLEYPASEPTVTLGVREREESRVDLETAPAPGTSRTGALRAAPFIGRALEIATLHTALATSCQRQWVTMCIDGASGIGKTATIERFLTEIEMQKGALVLRAHCHPQESIPFKAVDGVIDELTRFLVHQPPAVVAALLPLHIAALARIFPVLGRVPAIAAAVRAGVLVAEPHEIRRRAFAAFRDLLSRIGAQRPLVLWIDDLQWGDRDSASLLSELQHPPDAPKLLLVVSFRSEDRGASPILDVLTSRAGDDAGAPLYELHLGPLSADESQQLAGEIIAEAAALERDDLRAIADEAGGSPFFTCELARHAVSRLAATDRRVFRLPTHLAEVVSARIERLPVDARHLLEIVAIAGYPIEEMIAHHAAGNRGDLQHVLSLLRNQCLVRRVPVGAHAALASYHDRIRETVVAMMAPEARQALHRQLARTLESLPHPDPQLLVEHYLEAAEPERAAAHAYAAAEQAGDALAFNQAASLYRRAITLGSLDCPTWRLHAKLGDALINAGRGADGAASLLAAATALAAESPGDLDVVRLKRQAAEHYLRSGRDAQGLEVMREVVKAMGLSYPPTEARAVMSLLTNRAQLQVRRAFAAPVYRNPSAFERERLEVCWSAGLGLSYVDAVRAAEFQVRHALLAHRAGDVAHLARAVATESLILVWEGGLRKEQRSVRLQGESEQLVRAANDPKIDAHAQVMRAAIGYVHKQLREAIAIAERGDAFCRERCFGAAWEITQFQNVIGSSLALLGEFGEQRRRAPEYMREAAERGDEYALRTFRLGPMNLTWLAADQPDEARVQAQRGSAGCGEGGWFGYVSAYARAHVDLYCGEGQRGWEYMERVWPTLRRSQILRFQLARVDLCELRARCAIAAATEASTAAGRRRRLELAERDARRIAAEDARWVAPLADALRASVLVAKGDHDAAIAWLKRAAAGFDALEMGCRAAAVRYQLGRLLGAADGGALCAQQVAWMTAHGVEKPLRLATMYMPSIAIDS